MDNAEASPATPPEERFYIGRGEETFGPYLRNEIDQLHGRGQLAAGDFVWDEPRQAWIPLGEFLAGGLQPASEIGLPTPEAAPPSAPFPCDAHPDRMAAGHCEECEKLLCLSCIHHKGVNFYCSTCEPSADDIPKDDYQDRVAKVLGVFYEHPLYGVAIVLIAALAFMPSTGRAHAPAAEEGITVVESNRLWRQSLRTLSVADELALDRQEDRARRWYDLSVAAADRVIADKTISPLIREQCLMFQMRIALDLEQYELLNKLLADLKEQITRVLREADYGFFTSCNAYLYEKDVKRAIGGFESLCEHPTDGLQSIEMMIEVLSKPTRASEEAQKRLFAESFTEQEVLYRLGLCYDMDGQKDKARWVWQVAYKKAQAAGPADKWRRLAGKKLQE